MKSDSDRAIEELLRQSLSPPDINVATSSCLDMETIAAWVEGSLRGKNLEAAEQHVVSCGRCQAIAATVIRTTPAPAAREHPGWRGWRFRWLMPVAAVIAIGLSVSILRSDRRRVPASTEEAPQERSTLRQRDEARNEAPLEKKAELRATQPPAAPPAATAAEAPPAAAPVETRSADQRIDALGRVQSMREAIAYSPEIASPDGQTRWRISAPGSVEHSTDRGVTWETLSTGTSMAITAGSSPSALVCWLAGRSGTVLLSTDGRTWQRVPFPENVDLAAVQATDARTAVITAANGRQFRTDDAGTSWQ